MRLAHDLSLTRPQQRGSAAPSFLLDALPAPVLAFSTARRLATAYTGPLLRLRNSFTNIETDIGFTGSGDLNTAAIVAACGTDGGKMVRWCGQAGGIDFFASTAARQADIYSGAAFYPLGSSGRPSAHAVVGQAAGRYSTVVAGTTTTTSVPGTGDFTLVQVTRGFVAAWLRQYYRAAPPGIETGFWNPNGTFSATVAATTVASANSVNLVTTTPSIVAAFRRTGSDVIGVRNTVTPIHASAVIATALTPTMYFTLEDDGNFSAELLLWDIALSDSQLAAVLSSCVNYFGLAYP